ncbi:hypothetical protein N9K22_02415 [Candidatus Pelagibacter sp.]|nr:hypothetical protein [Candidatus Pelagibacter sp.]
MNRLLLILILTFTFQTLTKADDAIDKMFGVKLMEDISKYADIENGKKHPLIKNTYTFVNKDIDIERDPIFSGYYLRTNADYKIINVTAKLEISNSLDNFKNKCPSEKKDFISSLSSSLSIDIKNFKQYFHKGNVEGSTAKVLWNNSAYTYKDNGKIFRLIMYCSYLRRSDSSFSEALLISWLTEDYYRKNVLPRFELIDVFDTKFIKKYLGNN